MTTNIMTKQVLNQRQIDQIDFKAGKMNPQHVRGTIKVNEAAEVYNDNGDYIGLLTPNGILFENAVPQVTQQCSDFDIVYV